MPVVGYSPRASSRLPHRWRLDVESRDELSLYSQGLLQESGPCRPFDLQVSVLPVAAIVIFNVRCLGNSQRSLDSALRSNLQDLSDVAQVALGNRMVASGTRPNSEGYVAVQRFLALLS